MRQREDSWREAPERARTLTRSCALGLALPYGSAAPSEARSKPRPCAASGGSALSVIASRCHLSQSERPWQSAKFLGLYFTPCCRKGSRRRYAETFRLCQGLSLWESWREAPERARMRTRSCALGLALPCGSAVLSEARSKPRLCAASAGLALSVIASRCHLSQSERPWQSVKFPGLYFTPCCRKGSRRRCAQTSRLCQGLPLWGSWQSRQALTERASPAAETLRLCLAQRKIRQKQGCSRRGFTPV